MSQYPPLEVVDEDDNIIGEASLEEIYKQLLIHRIVMIVVHDPGGKILLQRRSGQVSTNPNRWDVSAAGHVDAGEDYLEAAHRELQEELGVKAELKETAYYYADVELDGKHLKRFVKVYEATLPIDTEFSIDLKEVTEVRWFEPEELKTRFQQNPGEFNKDLKVVFSKLNIEI